MELVEWNAWPPDACFIEKPEGVTLGAECKGTVLKRHLKIWGGEWYREGR